MENIPSPETTEQKEDISVSFEIKQDNNNYILKIPLLNKISNLIY